MGGYIRNINQVFINRKASNELVPRLPNSRSPEEPISRSEDTPKHFESQALVVAVVPKLRGLELSRPDLVSISDFYYLR